MLAPLSLCFVSAPSSPLFLQQSSPNWSCCPFHAVLVAVPATTTDEAFSSAAQKLRGLINVLPELPDEVQGALAMRVPGLLDLEPQEVRARLQTLAKTLELEFGLTARLVGKVCWLWTSKCMESFLHCSRGSCATYMKLMQCTGAPSAVLCELRPATVFGYR
jgi:hypothetical protein